MVIAMIYSAEVGTHKPGADIFHLVCRQLAVQPEETIFLDDREKHVEGATRCGLHSLLFTTTAQAIADIRRLISV